MDFNKHYNFEGKHALLGGSNYHWLNYDSKKLEEFFINLRAKEVGTELHAFAEECIKLRQKLPRSNKTLNMYVNDAIGYKMSPEVVLLYSENIFGTADTISFRDNMLRIHDLKTGAGPTHMEQLLIYAALFCLEYKKDPESIKMELRIYQNDDVVCYIPTGEEVRRVMNTIIASDKQLRELKEQEDFR